MDTREEGETWVYLSADKVTSEKGLDADGRGDLVFTVQVEGVLVLGEVQFVET